MKFFWVRMAKKNELESYKHLYKYSWMWRIASVYVILMHRLFYKNIIVEGKENLTSENETESFLRETNNVPKDVRISCQTQVLGDITVDATYW